MAELALGAVGTAVTLLPIVIKISRELRNAYRSVKYAQSELEGLTDEMDIFTNIYTTFLQSCAKVGEHQKRVYSAKEKLVLWTRRAILDYKKLLHKVDALARNPVYDHTVTEIAFAQCKWYFKKSYVVYLRASLNVARLSLVSFISIHNMAILDEQLVRLKAVISRRERREIEKEYGMTVEELQGMRDTFGMQQNGLPILLEEAQAKILAHTKQSRDHGTIEQMQQLRAFSESVNRYVDRVLPADTAGNRPPCPSRHSIARLGRYRHDSSLTSQTTATMSTTSTRPSHYQIPVPESPPISPEQSIAESVIDMQREEEGAISILKFCPKCSGICTSTETHNTSIQQSAPDISSCAIQYIPSTAPGPFSIQTSDAKRPSTPPRSQPRPTTHRQSGSSITVPASRLRPDSDQNRPPKPSVEHMDEERGTPQIDPAKSEVDEDYLPDGPPEENIPAEAQVTALKSSIWRPTVGFEGVMPKDLRIRRQRSRSPEDFW